MSTLTEKLDAYQSLTGGESILKSRGLAQNNDSGKLEEMKHEKPKRYTKGCFQRKLTFKQASYYLLFHYLAVSCVIGYFQAVQVNLQSNGASYSDQSTLSLALYPYSFKFLVSPFLDRFYFSNVGRSRTYIIFGGYVIAGTFLIIGPVMEYLMEHIKIIPLTITMGLSTIMLCLVQMSGESWVLTLFDNDEDKSKASTYLNVGYSIGYMIGYNLFTPLNDIDWLNANIFVNEPIHTAIVTHTMMCLFIAILFLLLATANLFFIAEQKIERSKQKSIIEILKVVPRHFTNSHMRNFIFYMFACMFLFFGADAILDLKLVKNGYSNFDRATLSNIGTIMYPISLLTSICTVYYMHSGQLIRMFHLTMGVLCLGGVFRLFMTFDLMYNRNLTRTFWARSFVEILKNLDFSTYFLMGFFNTVVDESVGNTGITCLISLMNQTSTLSQTLGFALLNYFSFEIIVIFSLAIQVVILIVLYPYALRIDRKDTKLYSTFNIKV